MAKYLIFDEEKIGIDGLITLTRGDDWNLTAKIREIIGNYSKDLNLVDEGIVGVTGYFENDSSVQSTPVSVDVVTGDCPSVLIVDVSNSDTLAAKVAENGTGAYVIVEYTNADTETIYTKDHNLAIVDRGFSTF